MKSIVAICVLFMLATEGLARPSEKLAEKVPKKFDSSIHSVDKKKTDQKVSTYENYSPTQEQDSIRPPSVVIQQQPYSDFTQRVSGYVFDQQTGIPKLILTVPAEDSYSNPEGVGMEGLEVPSDSKIEESKSYIGYNIRDESSPMMAPEASSYSMLSLEQLEELLSASASSPSVALAAPEIIQAEEQDPSSYVSYANPSSYDDYERPAIGTGEKLRPPPIAEDF